MEKGSFKQGENYKGTLRSLVAFTGADLKEYHMREREVGEGVVV